MPLHRTLVHTLCVLAACTAFVACHAEVRGEPGSEVTGKASWYGGRFHGRKTASGERFDKRALTAAHRSLPFGTMVQVTVLKTGRSVRVRINDRGPFGSRERIIDLSEAAAEVVGMKSAGVVRIKLKVLQRPKR